MNKVHPFTGFLELQRKTAKGYTCPICEEIYHQEPKIWAHGLRNHQEYLGNTGSTEKAEGIRKRFRQEALDKT